MAVTLLLDTTAGETGTEQNIGRDYKLPAIGVVQCDLSTGDVVVVEGRTSTDMTLRTLVTFSANDPPQKIDPLPSLIRARRSTDGTVGEARVELVLAER